MVKALLNGAKSIWKIKEDPSKLRPNDKEDNDHEKILTSQEKFYVISECKSLHEYLQTSQKWMLKGAMNEKIIQEIKRLADYKNL